MDRVNVFYFGSIASVADEIFLSDHFSLKKIFCERKKVTSELLTFAYLRAIPLEEIDNKDHLERMVFQESSVKIALMCGFGFIISKSFLKKIRVFNFHAGKLPDYKGRHPTFFATVNGEPCIHISLHEVNEKIDEGIFIASHLIKYGFDKSEDYILSKIPFAISFLLPQLHLFLNNKIAGRIITGGRYYPPVQEIDKTFSEEDHPSKILQIIRAQARYGGGVFCWKGKVYNVFSAIVVRIPVALSVEEKVIFDEKGFFGIRINQEHAIRFTEYKENFEY